MSILWDLKLSGSLIRENLYLTSGSDNLALHQVSEVVPKGALDHLGILVEQPEQVDLWAEYFKFQMV